MFLMNLFNLLTNNSVVSDSASDILDSLSDSAGKAPGLKEKLLTYGLFGLIAVGFIVFMIFQSRSRKKQQKETAEMLDAVKPGNKVKTIGGICGIVVEVCPEDNTFVLETGTEASGKSYLKFDKQAIYQTDAVAKPAEKKEEKAEEKPVEEAPVEETPVEEVVAETEKKDEE